jgi:hypothetical protein
MNDITTARGQRDAFLATIPARRLDSMTEVEIKEWRDAHAAYEPSWLEQPAIGPMIDHVLGVFDAALVACRDVSIYRRDENGGSFVTARPNDVVLTGTTIDFAGLSIAIHDTGFSHEQVDALRIGDDYATLIHTDTEKASALHDVIRAQLDGWRESGETLLVTIDGETVEAPASEVWAYGFSLSIPGRILNLDALARLHASEGLTMRSPTIETVLLTADGHEVSIAPVRSLDLTREECRETLSNMLNSDFGPIYLDLIGIPDTGRNAVQVPGVRRVVVQARDLKPMHQAYADQEAATGRQAGIAAEQAAIDAMPAGTDEEIALKHAAQAAHYDKPRPEYHAPTYEEGGLIDVLVWEPKGPVDALDLTRAAWAGYVLSLKASEDLGLNPRCHVTPGGLADVAAAHVADIGAVATPHDCVYGSDMAYWECSQVSFDADTGTIVIVPSLGS